MKLALPTVLTKPQVLLNLVAVSAIFYSTIDRLYWVNGGPGMSGWINKTAVPLEFSQCRGKSVEYKRFPGYVDYRCSALGSDLPFWPFIHSGTTSVGKVVAIIP